MCLRLLGESVAEPCKNKPCPAPLPPWPSLLVPSYPRCPLLSPHLCLAGLLLQQGYQGTLALPGSAPRGSRGGGLARLQMCGLTREQGSLPLPRGGPCGGRLRTHSHKAPLLRLEGRSSRSPRSPPEVLLGVSGRCTCAVQRPAPVARQEGWAGHKQPLPSAPQGGEA
uniref:Uncharacterized protein n=1 Tax=Crocodylus porosus TaxID=8502 RepID=A0A7M4EGG4_CROPO